MSQTVELQEAVVLEKSMMFKEVPSKVKVFRSFNKKSDSLSVGETIALLTVNDDEKVMYGLEGNGEEGDMYLELVKYHFSHLDADNKKVYQEQTFSDCIYEMPTTEIEAVALLLNQIELMEQAD